MNQLKDIPSMVLYQIMFIKNKTSFSVHKKVVECWRRNHFIGQNGVYQLQNGVCTLFCAQDYYGPTCGFKRY